MNDFKGKNAVITGAGSGIGRGMALAFAQQGMRVVVSDVERNAAQAVAQEISDAGGKALAVATDVSDPSAVRDLASSAVKAFGPVHVLCNNAGVMIQRRGIDATHEDWLWVIGVNLWGVIHGMEAFLPGMRAHGEDAHIVNTASMNGIFPSAYSAMYSTSKYAVLGLSETFAQELKGSKVGISILCPAAVTTRIHEAARNRPKALAPSQPAPAAHERSASFDISPPLDPLAVGELVLNGIRHRQLHIFTDLKVKPIVQARHDRMIAEFERFAEWQRSAARP
jgi:NAD(P)-dependent dehydrogenase (short-subunit alcohol dehydrogenase family)